MIDAVILMPGIMGSELKKGDELVWPGKPWEVLTPYTKMDKLLDPDLEVGDIIRSVFKGVYAPLIPALEHCGFAEKGDTPTLLVCPYDWRQDNARSATTLANCVHRLRDLHGDTIRIDIVAHSMGGLVARHFLESQRFDEGNCPGFNNIRSLITMGTPHRGAPLALAAALGGVKRLFLSAEQVKQLAAKEEFPSLYQLLPPGGDPFVWNSAANARLDSVDVYDDGVIESFKLSKANIASAQAFRRSLDIQRKPANVSYFCFVGTSMDTYGHVRADFTASQPAPQPISVQSGGDGTVPMWSASLPGVRQLAVNGEHGTIFNDPRLLSTLGSLLGKRGYLASNDEAFRVSLGSEVVEPKTCIQILFAAGKAVSVIDAEIVLIKLTGVDGKALEIPQDLPKPQALHYNGPPLESITIQLEAPTYAGAYAVDLRSGGKSIVQTPPILLVQQA